MYNIIWKIEWMKCLTKKELIDHYVVECGWRATATKDSYAATSYGSCTFSVDTSTDTLIPYAELTEEQVLNWCWTSGLNKNATESDLEQRLSDLISPQIVQLSLPWQS